MKKKRYTKSRKRGKADRQHTGNKKVSRKTEPRIKATTTTMRFDSCSFSFCLKTQPSVSSWCLFSMLSIACVCRFVSPYNRVYLLLLLCVLIALGLCVCHASVDNTVWNARKHSHCERTRYSHQIEKRQTIRAQAIYSVYELKQDKKEEAYWRMKRKKTEANMRCTQRANNNNDSERRKK